MSAKKRSSSVESTGRWAVKSTQETKTYHYNGFHGKYTKSSENIHYIDGRPHTSDGITSNKRPSSPVQSYRSGSGQSPVRSHTSGPGQSPVRSHTAGSGQSPVRSHTSGSGQSPVRSHTSDPGYSNKTSFSTPQVVNVDLTDSNWSLKQSSPSHHGAKVSPGVDVLKHRRKSTPHSKSKISPVTGDHPNKPHLQYTDGSMEDSTAGVDSSPPHILHLSSENYKSNAIEMINNMFDEQDGSEEVETSLNSSMDMQRDVVTPSIIDPSYAYSNPAMDYSETSNGKNEYPKELPPVEEIEMKTQRGENRIKHEEENSERQLQCDKQRQKRLNKIEKRKENRNKTSRKWKGWYNRCLVIPDYLSDGILYCCNDNIGTFQSWSQRKRVYISIIGSIILVSLIVIISVMRHSFMYVEYNQLALRRTKSTWAVGDRVYYPGCYAYGPDMHFYLFSSTTRQTNVESLSCFTRDKNRVRITATVWWRIRSEELDDVYNKFGRDFADIYPNIFFSTIRNTSPQFSLDDYIEKRTTIEQIMHQSLYDRVSGSCCPSCCGSRVGCSNSFILSQCTRCNTNKSSCTQGHHINVKHFYITRIQILDEIEERYLNAAINRVQVETAAFKQEVAIEGKINSMYENQELNKAKEVEESAEAEAKKIRDIATYDADVLETNATAIALHHMCQSLGVTQEQEKLSLFFIQTLGDLGRKGKLKRFVNRNGTTV